MLSLVKAEILFPCVPVSLLRVDLLVDRLSFGSGYRYINLSQSQMEVPKERVMGHRQRGTNPLPTGICQGPIWYGYRGKGLTCVPGYGRAPERKADCEVPGQRGKNTNLRPFQMEVQTRKK